MRRLGRQSPSRIWICRTVSFDTRTPSISRSFRMRPRIAGVWDERRDVPALDLVGRPRAELGAFSASDSCARRRFLFRAKKPTACALNRSPSRRKIIPCSASQSSQAEAVKVSKTDCKSNAVRLMTLLGPAEPSDLAAALAYALRYQGRKRVGNTDEIMAEIVAKRLVEHLERAGLVVMKRPAEIGGAAGGFEG